MLGRSKRWLAMAGALAVCAALLGCGGDQSIASKSAEAFREAQAKGETVGGDGHGHGHGAVTPGSTHAESEALEAGPGDEHTGGHDHGAPEAPASGGGHEGHGAGEHVSQPAGRSTGHEAHGTAGAGQHEGDHSAMDHRRSTASSRGGMPRGHEDSGHAGHSGDAGQAGHAGHGTASPQAPGASAPPQGADHTGHAGHPAGKESPTSASSPAPVAVPPEQPAKTLQPDALDAPAATSVVDAQRSAEMARGMAGGHGGHGGHGVVRYRHVDAGRGPEAHLEEDQSPGAGSDHTGHEAHEAAGLYVCPMHPDVTSDKPGTCPKCGMALVERRKE